MLSRSEASPSVSLGDKRFFASPERCLVSIVGASSAALGLAQNDGVAVWRMVFSG